MTDSFHPTMDLRIARRVYEEKGNGILYRIFGPASPPFITNVIEQKFKARDGRTEWRALPVVLLEDSE